MKPGKDFIGVGVGVLILKEDKVLMILRKNSAGENTWALPGGHLELKETFENAAVRECKEELGIKIKPIKLLSVSNDMVYETHYITLGILAEIESGEPKIMEPEKFIEIDWHLLDNLPKNLFIPSERIIKNFKDGQMK
jgi:8-oxo-dGTP diphosphatase